MRLHSRLAAIAATAAICLNAAAQDTPAIIPLPAKIETSDGTLKLPQTIGYSVAAYPGDSIATVMQRFIPDFEKATGSKFTESDTGAMLTLSIDPAIGA